MGSRPGFGRGGLAAQDGDGGALRAGQPAEDGRWHGGDEGGRGGAGRVAVGGLRGEPQDPLPAGGGLGGGGPGDLGLADAGRVR
ncbi:hypothetical protein LUX02_22595 [Streptomyces somaliensis]|nr:hypothetical protein [Streptomyces somaliensis]